MSKEIDEKVVEMRFDNKQFEQNVSTTMSTLEKLKKSLQLKDSAKAFNDIDSAAKRVNFSGLKKEIDSVGTKFNELKKIASESTKPVVQQFLTFGSSISDVVHNVSSDILRVASDVSVSFSQLIDPIVQKSTLLATNLSSTLGQATASLGSSVQSTASGIGSSLKNLAESVSNHISGIPKVLAIAAASATVIIGGVLIVSSSARDKLREIALTIKTAIVSAAEAVREKLGSVAMEIAKHIITAADNIKQKVENVTNGIKTFLSTTADAIKTKFAETSPVLFNIVSYCADSIKQKVHSVGEEIHASITSVIERIKEKLESVSHAFESLSSKIKSKFKKEDTGIQEITEELDELKKSAQESADAVETSMNDIRESIEDTKNAVSDSSGSSFEEKVKTTTDEIKKEVSNVKEDISSKSKAAAEDVSDAADQTSESFESASEKIEGSSSIFEKLGKIGENLKSKFSDIGKNLPDSFGKFGETIKSVFSKVGDKLPDKFKDVAGKIKECAKNSGSFGKILSTALSAGLPLLSKFKGQFKDISDGTDQSNTAMLKLGGAVETVASKFSSFGLMAKGYLEDLGKRALRTGEQWIKSLSVDNIRDGWDKFGEKTTSVGTLIAQGYDLEEVNKQLDNLNWFTDETSYNFTDMVNEIGKFTASGQNLEDSVTAMKGIASWAALSGQNASTASRAMYQLSQAMGAGVMRREDYKSIATANMDTKEFRQHAIDAAIALGTLKENADGTYTSIAKGAKQTTFTIDQFMESLTEGQWFTSDVMMSVYKEYGRASNTIMAYMDKYADDADHKINTASEAMDDIEEKAKAYQETMSKAGKDISLDEALKKISLDELKEIPKIAEEAEQFMSEFNGSLKAGEEPIKTVEEALDKMGYGLDEFSLKALRAGQEARTWKDVIASVKDAVSTGWMTTFEKIIGNYEEAKELWTGAANELYDVFASGAETRNDILQTWRDLGGRNDLLQGLTNSWEMFKGVLQSVKDAMREVFLGTTDNEEIIKKLGTALSNVSSKIKEFTERFVTVNEVTKELEFTEAFSSRLEKLKTTFKGLFAAVDIVKQIFQKAFQVIKPLFGLLPGASDGILGVTSSIGEFLIKIDEFLKNNTKLDGALATISGGFKKLSDAVSSGLSILGSFWEKVKTIVSNVSSVIGGTLQSVFEGIQDSLKNGDFKSIFNVAAVGLAAKKLFGMVTKAGSKLGGFVKGIAEQVKDILDSVKESLEAFQKDIKAGTLLKIGKAVALLAGSIFILSLIDPKRLASALTALTVTFGELMGAMAWFTKIAEKIGDKDIGKINMLSKTMVTISASVLILAFALKKIGSMETEDIIEGLVGVGALMAGLVIVCQKLSAIEGEIIKGMGSILIFSFALLILSTAVKSLGKLDPASLVKGLIGVTVLLAEMVAMSKIIAGIDSAGMISACFSLILMSVALRIAVSSVKALSDMKPEQLTTGIIGVSAILMLFAGIAGALSQLKEKAVSAIPGAVAMVAMAIALKIAAEPFKELGKMGWDQIAKAAVSMLAVFGIFGGLVALCAAFSAATLAALAGAVAMVAFAVVLKMVVAPFQELGNMSWEQIIKAAVAMIAIFEVFGSLVAICAVLGVAVLAAIPGAISMAILAAALKMAVAPFQELGNMSWEQIGKGVVGIVGLLGLLGALGALLGVLSPALLAGSIALIAIGASFKMATAALSAGLDSIAECITKMSTIDPGEFASTIAAISAGIAALGLALIAFNPLSLIGATSMFILSEAILKLAPALLMLKLVGPEDISNEMRVLSIGMAEFGLALKAFGPLAGIGASAMLELGTAIGIMAPGLAVLSAIPGTGVSDTLDTLAEAFVKFGKALKETPFFGAKSRAQGINTLTDGIKKLSEALPTLVNDVDQTKMATALTNISDAFVKFGEAISAAPFWSAKSRGEGIGIVVDSIKSLSESLPDIVALENVDYKAVLTGIGEGMQSFGTAISKTPLFNSKSGGQGIATLVGSLSDLAAGLQALDELQTNSIRIKNRMTAIGEGLQSFSTIIATTPLFNSDERANGIATMVKSISDLANGMQALNDLQTNNLRIKNRMTAIGEAFQALSSALLGTPLFNSEERATGLSTLVSSLSKLVPSIKTLSEMTVDTERISGIFTALGEGMKAIGKSIKEVGKNSEEKAGSISTVITSIKDLSYALKGISTIKDTDVGTLGAQLGTAISSIKIAAEGFVGLNLDSFSSMVSALNKMIPSLQSLTTINTKTISSNLTAVSTALTSFSSSTSGMAESLVNFSTLGTTAATNFATGYSEAISSLASTFTTSGETAISSYNTGMSNKRTNATVTARSIASACVNAIRLWYVHFKNAGSYVVQGFVAGMSSQEALQSAYDAGYKLGEQAEKGTKDATKESSPSKVFYQRGWYCVLGFVNSFYDGLTSSEIAGKDLAYSAIDGASFALKRASDILDSDLELQPTIRPVIDLSNVQNGVNTLNGIFGAQSLSVNTSTKLSGYTAATMTPNIEVMKRTTGSQNDDVVRAIQTLRSDVNTLSQRFEGLQITIDGKKTVGALTRRIDRSLGKAQVSRKKGV